MLNFGNKVEERGDLITKDMLLWVRISVRGTKKSQQTNGTYVDLELTIAENQPFAGRKIWDTIMDPNDALNSQEAREMGYGKVRRILEGVFGANPSNQNSYNLPNWESLGGQHLVPIMVGIQKGKDGYEDKNVVGEYLSPHSSVKKVVECYNLIRQGVNKYEKTQKPAAGAPQQQGFGGMPAMSGAPVAAGAPAAFTPPQGAPAAAAGGNAPGWLAPTPAAAPAPVQQQAAPVPQQQPAPMPQTAHTGTVMAADAGSTQQGGFVAPAPQHNAPAGFPPQQGYAQAAESPVAPTTPAAAQPAPFPSNGAPAQQWQPPQQGGALPLPGTGQ